MVQKRVLDDAFKKTVFSSRTGKVPGDVASLTLKSTGRVQNAYGDARIILEGLNEHPGSDRYRNARRAVLHAFQAVNPDVEYNDLRGASFLKGDPEELEQQLGVRVFPATVLIPPEMWTTFYFEDPNSGISLPYHEQMLIQTQRGITDQKLEKFAESGGFLTIPAPDGPYRNTVTGGREYVFAIHKGFGLSRKLHPKEFEESERYLLSGGCHFSSHDYRFPHPWSEIGGISILVDSQPSHHEDIHGSQDLNFFRAGTINRELGAYLGDVLEGSRSGDEIKETLKSGIYQGHFVNQPEEIDAIVDTIIYFAKHFSPHVAMRYVETAGAGQIPQLPDRNLMGDVASRALMVLTSQRTWNGNWYELERRYSDQEVNHLPANAVLGHGTEMRVLDIESKMERKIERLKPAVAAVNEVYDPADAFYYLFQFTSTDDFLENVKELSGD